MPRLFESDEGDEEERLTDMLGRREIELRLGERGDWVLERGEELAEEPEPGLVIVSQLAMLEAPGEGRELVKLVIIELRCNPGLSECNSGLLIGE